MLRPDIQPARIVNRGIRKILPRSLLGRSLLMILLPLVLLQAVALQIFYGSHLDIVSRRLSGAVAGEIGYTLELLSRYPDPADRVDPEQGQQRVRSGHDDRARRHAARPCRRPTSWARWTTTWPSRCATRPACLSSPTGAPTAVTVLIRVQLPKRRAARRRRRASGCMPARSTCSCSGSSASRRCCSPSPRCSCATRCARIRRLASAAEAFGMGRDIGPIKPEGATEVRQAALRVQSHAGAHSPLPGAAHRDAGRRLARSAHAADPAAAGAGDDAGARGAAAGRRRDDRRRRGDGADDRRLPRLRARRGHRAGGAGEPLGGAGGCCGRRASRRRRGGAGCAARR